MKGLRKMACGLAAAVCLLAATPVAWAGQSDTPPVAAEREGWIAAWVEWVAGWFGWGEEEPRAQIEVAFGELDPNKPEPAPQGDCTGGLDPMGTPCRP